MLKIKNGQFSTDGMALQETIPSGYRPNVEQVQSSKIFNGTDYVDCAVWALDDGTVKITNMFGNKLTGVQIQYLQSKLFTYITADPWPSSS